MTGSKKKQEDIRPAEYNTPGILITDNASPTPCVGENSHGQGGNLANSGTIFAHTDSCAKQYRTLHLTMAGAGNDDRDSGANKEQK